MELEGIGEFVDSSIGDSPSDCHLHLRGHLYAPLLSLAPNTSWDEGGGQSLSLRSAGGHRRSSSSWSVRYGGSRPARTRRGRRRSRPQRTCGADLAHVGGRLPGPAGTRRRQPGILEAAGQPVVFVRGGRRRRPPRHRQHTPDYTTVQ
jgi:hypothetical protein